MSIVIWIGHLCGIGGSCCCRAAGSYSESSHLSHHHFVAALVLVFGVALVTVSSPS